MKRYFFRPESLPSAFESGGASSISIEVVSRIGDINYLVDRYTILRRLHLPKKRNRNKRVESDEATNVPAVSIVAAFYNLFASEKLSSGDKSGCQKRSRNLADNSLAPKTVNKMAKFILCNKSCTKSVKRLEPWEKLRLKCLSEVAKILDKTAHWSRVIPSFAMIKIKIPTFMAAIDTTVDSGLPPLLWFLMPCQTAPIR